MKAVLDTNVLISGVISTGVPHDLLVRGLRGEFGIIVTIETLTEFRETLLKYPDKFHMDEAEVGEAASGYVVARTQLTGTYAP